MKISKTYAQNANFIKNLGKIRKSGGDFKILKSLEGAK